MPQGTSQFRSGVTLVPLDVRVVDAKGNPVTDLKAADFTIYEDDARQEIAHFLTIEPGGELATSLVAGDNPLAETVSPHRTFIIVLGRGRLQGPVKGIEALIGFVGKLLPTDRVGVVAYLRVAAPTTDHTSIRRFLERYRDRHEDIEGSMDADFRHALFLVLLSDRTRAKIDALFEHPGLPVFTELPGAAGTSASRYMDLTYLAWTIESAARIPGEKHIIVLSQASLGLSRISDNPGGHVLVQRATAARATLSYINSGGVSGQAMIRGRVVIPKGAQSDALTSILGITDAEFHAPYLHRLLAAQTGGVSSFYQYAAKTLDLLDRSSRFQYVLGYYPTNAKNVEAPHRIRVEINRPGVTPLYRHADQSRTHTSDAADFREAVAEDRLEAGLEHLANPPESYRRYPQHFRSRTTLKIEIPDAIAAGTSGVLVRLSFDPTMVTFQNSNGRFRTNIQLVVVADGENDAIVGQHGRKLTVDLSADEFARTKRNWLSFDVTVPVTASPRRIRAAVYEYESDRVLSAMIPYRGGR
jgi:VWFA-related protein